ncbi:hypothetical protein [Glycomyces paridis]|uniref:Uncharacterized protein n=1 Tax=Glycomyces paridis TaxID=2126555 RepID=A0A4S8PMM4_9ACTN|nr:hypothetical protein [Glycomyces paridis]THV30892.1 hypothetical protein E9998_05845 [Glycomyces paridis]
MTTSPTEKDTRPLLARGGMSLLVTIAQLAALVALFFAIAHLAGLLPEPEDSYGWGPVILGAEGSLLLTVFVGPAAAALARLPRPWLYALSTPIAVLAGYATVTLTGLWPEYTGPAALAACNLAVAVATASRPLRRRRPAPVEAFDAS